MRLTKIEITGFKSFKDKLVLAVPKGITAIVGPNGCGKSNIIDAIKWALGEQNPRSLRAKSMEDVIFAGTADFSPVGMAEISLFFERANTPFPEPYSNLNELVITRRLYRSGDSEYLINRSPCRLKDIIDITVDTGLGQRFYGLIEQGMIESFMNYKPEEKRLIFDEVAGTAKYRLRKKATLQKLDSAKQNLDRVEDILSEVERNYYNLEKEAKRAYEYKKIFEELKTIEIYKNSLNYKKLKEIFIDKQERLNTLTNLISYKEVELENIFSTIENKRNELFFTERELEEGRKKYFSLIEKINQIEKELSSLKEGKDFRVGKIKEVSEKIDELSKEKDKKIDLKNTFEEEIKNFEKKLIEKEDALKKEENEEVKLKEGLKNLNIELTNLQREIIRDKNQLGYLQSQLSYEEKIYNDTIKKQEFLSKERDELVSQTNLLKSHIENFRKEILEKEKEKEKIEDLIKEKTDIINNEKKKAVELRKKLQELELKKERLNGFLNSSKKFIEDYGGFSKGSKEVLKHFEKDRVYGTLLDFIEVDREHINLFENLMGDKIELIFVKDLATVKEVINYLNEKRAGSSYLYIVDEKEPDQDISLPSFIKINTNRKDIINSLKRLFNRIRLIEDLDKLDTIKNETLILKNGLVIDTAGIFHGGSGEKHNPFLTEKTKIKELEEQQDFIKHQIETLAKELKDKERMIHELDEFIKENKDSLANLNIELSSDKTELKHKEEELKRRNSKLEMLKAEQKNLEINIQTYLKKKSDYNEKIKALNEEIAKKEALIVEKNNHIERIRFDIDSKSKKLTELKVSMAEEKRNLHHKKEALIRIKDEIAKINKDLEFLIKEKLSLENLDRDADERFKKYSQQLDTLKSEQIKEDNILKQKEAFLNSLRSDLREMEKKYNQNRNEIERIRKESNSLKDEITEINLNLKVMLERIREKYFIDLDKEFEKYLELPLKEGEITDEKIEYLSQKLRDLGEVNILAIDEFEEIKKRYEFLKKQKEDIEMSIKSLNEAIERINKITIELFTKSIKNIEENFDRVFKRLFGGGKAKIILTDENNILESGVDINVEVPYKKAKNIELLSGGEKALVAISLMFAFYMQKPSPFCLLDEVDAPLDDTNVIKFRSLLKEMAVFSQFMIVTHNKLLMEDIDALYGVTMEVPGVSKIVSVKIEKGELWQ